MELEQHLNQVSLFSISSLHLRYNNITGCDMVEIASINKQMVCVGAEMFQQHNQIV